MKKTATALALMMALSAVSPLKSMATGYYGGGYGGGYYTAGYGYGGGYGSYCAQPSYQACYQPCYQTCYQPCASYCDPCGGGGWGGNGLGSLLTLGLIGAGIGLALH